MADTNPPKPNLFYKSLGLFLGIMIFFLALFFLSQAGYITLPFMEKSQEGIEVPVKNNTVVPNEMPQIFDIKISSLTCKWTVKTGDYGVKSDCVRIISRGTAQGPVGARVELPLLSWSTDAFDCGAWTHKTGALVAVGHTCVRNEGQPEKTSWTVDTEGDECPTKNYYSSERSHSVKIYSDGDLEPQKEDSKSVVCQ
jgi:hypothetical protein